MFKKLIFVFTLAFLSIHLHAQSYFGTKFPPGFAKLSKQYTSQLISKMDPWLKSIPELAEMDTGVQSTAKVHGVLPIRLLMRAVMADPSLPKDFIEINQFYYHKFMRQFSDSSQLAPIFLVLPIIEKIEFLYQAGYRLSDAELEVDLNHLRNAYQITGNAREVRRFERKELKDLLKKIAEDKKAHASDLN